MKNTADAISPDEEKIISELTSGILSEETRELYENQEMPINRLVKTDDGETLWLHNGMLFRHEDLVDDFEMIDLMPDGMRNVMLTGNEIASYLDWKKEETKRNKERKKEEGVMAIRSLVSGMETKPRPTLGEWLGRQEGTPDPGHTETDDEDLDWGDLG